MRIAAIAGGIILCANTGAAYAQMSARPAILEIDADTASGSEVVTLENQGDTPLQVRLSIGDFEQKANGVHEFAAPGSHPRSCAKRLAVSPSEVTILPGEVQPVTVRMATGGELCWSVVYATVLPQEGAAFQLRQEIAIKTYGSPGTLPRAGRITSVEAAALDTAVMVHLSFENQGPAPLRPSGRIEIRTLDGEVVATEAIDAFSALPGRRRHITAHISKVLPSGEYLAVPILDYGADHLVGGQQVFRVR